ncbi:MAG: NifB/NifX family molybdenum-iron cluster-binding protein [Rectinemataceae bacterium]
MKIAIPLVNGVLSSHFGHCDRFAIITADPASKKILSKEEKNPPPHEPGLYPSWLANLGITHVIAGGMGESAINLFVQNHIEVIAGVSGDTPEKIAQHFLKNTLVTGNNYCTH